jgi:hypothetical protein
MLFVRIANDVTHITELIVIAFQANREQQAFNVKCS